MEWLEPGLCLPYSVLQTHVYTPPDTALGFSAPLDVPFCPRLGCGTCRNHVESRGQKGRE